MSKGIAFAALGGAVVVWLIIGPVALGLAHLSSQGGGTSKCGPTETGGSNPSAGAGPKYLIGDSIAVGLKGKLNDFTINGQVSRTLAQGLNEINSGKDVVAKSGTVVVELGTNKSGDFKGDADKMIGKIRSFNPDAQIYWVQIFSNGDYGQENKVISGLKSVSMIQTKNKNIPLADGIHPTPEGYQKLAGIIDQAVEGGGTNGTQETSSGEDCPPTGGSGSASCEKLSGTPKDIIDNQALGIAHGIDFKDVTPKSVEAANAEHSTNTTSGNLSDHKGPPARAWAADISDNWEASNGSPNMTKLARALADCFNVKWSGSGLVNSSKDGYRIQLIYKTNEGGNHFNHVHIGVRKE